MLLFYCLRKDVKMEKLKNKFAAGSIVITSVLLSTVPAFAANDILDNARDIITKYYDTLSGIAIGIGMLLAVVALIMWFVFPSDKGAETGKKWFVRILLCIGILLSLGGILGFIQNLTADAGFDANGYVNSIPKIK